MDSQAKNKIEMKNWRCKFCHHLLGNLNEELIKKINGIDFLNDNPEIIEVKCSKCKTMNIRYIH